MDIKYQRPLKTNRPSDNLRLEGDRHCYSSRYEREYGVLGFRKTDNSGLSTSSSFSTDATTIDSTFPFIAEELEYNEDDGVSTTALIGESYVGSYEGHYVQLGGEQNPVFTVEPVSGPQAMQQGRSPYALVARRIIPDDGCVYGSGRKMAPEDKKKVLTK